MSCSKRVAVWVAAALALAPFVARADKAAAEVAFAEGKRLMAAGKVAEACPKFELSFKEDPQLGTQLNLADCHEKLGKLATAWAEFRAAMELAKNRGDEREQFAKERAAALAPRISKLVLRKRGEHDGLRVLLDGRDVTALVGIAIPVDPGEHIVASRAKELDEASETVTIEGEGRRVELDVPIRGEPEEADVSDDAPPSDSSARRTRQVIGLGTAAAGLVVSGVGLYFGKRASDDWDASRAFCDEQNRCDPEGATLVDDAKSSATVATVLVGVGVGALAVGTIVYLTAPREQTGRVAARPIVTPSVIGGALTVQF